MSFATDMYTIMIGDSSINSEVNGIYYENFPDNSDLTKNWIVYRFNRAEQVDCLSIKDAYTVYDLMATIICPGTTDVATLNYISDLLVDYLNGNEGGEIVDINFTGDGHSFDQEKNVYMNTLNFNVISD